MKDDNTLYTIELWQKHSKLKDNSELWENEDTIIISEPILDFDNFMNYLTIKIDEYFNEQDIEIGKDVDTIFKKEL